jgi:AcrR family transcriptional regulator
MQMTQWRKFPAITHLQGTNYRSLEVFMASDRLAARERIIREAMRLFSEKGYERTSVADIQAAAGLAPGSGALYKHFASKEEVLRAGLEPYIAEAQRAKSLLHAVKIPPAEALSAMAQQTLDILAARQNELRIVWRDLEQFPTLQVKVRREIMQNSYRALSDWLRDRSGQGEIRMHDSDAVAAVLLGSLTMFKVFEALWGEKTIPVNDKRFHRAWCDLMVAGLGLQEQATDAGAPTDKPARGTARSKRRR